MSTTNRMSVERQMARQKLLRLATRKQDRTAILTAAEKRLADAHHDRCFGAHVRADAQEANSNRLLQTGGEKTRSETAVDATAARALMWPEANRWSVALSKLVKLAPS